MDSNEQGSLRERLDAIAERARAAEEARAEAQARIAALEAERAAMLASRSWRLTGPLRWLSERLGKASGSGGGQAVGAEAATVEEAGAEAPEGVATLPPGLRREPGDGIESANAACRLIDLSPGLAGLVDPAVRDILAGTDAGRDRLWLGAGSSPPLVGLVGGRELALDLAFDTRVLRLREDGWQAQLDAAAPAFVILEAAWHVDQYEWRYAMVEDGARTTGLRALLAACRGRGIPVVLWLSVADAELEAFQWLLGEVELACVACDDQCRRLQARFPDARLMHLPPSIQPRLHNPVRTRGLDAAREALVSRVVFDGWWDLAGQAAGIEELSELRRSGLLVAESHWEFGQVRLPDQPAFAGHVIGCLDREERIVFSRLVGAEVFTGQALCGHPGVHRRVLRTAAGGAVVAPLGPAPANFPVEGLWREGDGAQARLGPLLADDLQRMRHAHAVWRRLMDGHTVAHRLEAIAGALGLGLAFHLPPARVGCVLVTMRPDRIPECIERFRRDAYAARELVVVVHGDRVDRGALARLVGPEEPIRILAVPRSRSLGACLNFAIDQLDSEYWLKVDDDDLYGTQYISDIMRYQRLGRFDVFGKPPAFNHLESGDELLWDSTWADCANLLHESATARSALVAGGTLGGRRWVVDKVPFSETRRGGSDSDFVRRCYRAGIDVLSMDPFNFVRCRSATPGFHTWQVADSDLRGRARRVGGGSDIASTAML
ncbi:MAG: hypothetical protein ACXIUZ_14845 [Lysobacteraceae bacterium]